MTQPVLSCWNDNADTDIVDVHHYDSDFAAWTEAAASNPKKGSFFTEAGSRWYQGFAADSGSTLLVLNWLQALRVMHTRGQFTAPVPGAMVSWELMVGNSNTRWHWNTPDNRLDSHSVLNSSLQQELETCRLFNKHNLRLHGVQQFRICANFEQKPTPPPPPHCSKVNCLKLCHDTTDGLQTTTHRTLSLPRMQF